jgi:tRNA(Ile)-lysidine synthase
VVRPGERVLVGYSGGLDSVVLLDILGRLARRRRIRLSALHVNHQLSPNASSWERFCRRTCRERAIPFRSVRVNVAPGDSVEAAARAARYAVLLAQPVEHVALAHHQDDQVETVLLQLLRGAGVRGLAAMPLVRSSFIIPNSSLPHRPSLLRPLLNVPRSELENYARRRRLPWIEDESNRDTRYARNYLRHELLPALAVRFPAYRATLARSAHHLAEAARLLDELAESDATGACHEGVLAVAALRRHTGARARNLLRWFLDRHGAAMPNADRLAELLRQAVTAKEGARVRVELASHDLYRWRGGLHVVPRWPPVSLLARPWRRARRTSVPELGGALLMERGKGRGIALARLAQHPVAVRARAGGERFRPDADRPRRTLKNLFQERGVPPWERDRLPLLHCGSDLVWVPGIGIDCAYQAAPGEPSVCPAWVAADRPRVAARRPSRAGIA